ncbi:MAG: hypothetical protein JXR60_11105 [Bacteroidales bacterium]|nr:hypothetical protein [Bacteroidales bacterium]
MFKVRAYGGPSLHWTLQSLEVEKNNINNAIAYLNVGGGLDVGIVTFDLRLDYGLTKVYDSAGSESIQLASKSNIITFAVGLVF